MLTGHPTVTTMRRRLVSLNPKTLSGPPIREDKIHSYVIVDKKVKNDGKNGPQPRLKDKKSKNKLNDEAQTNKKSSWSLNQKRSLKFQPKNGGKLKKILEKAKRVVTSSSLKPVLANELSRTGFSIFSWGRFWPEASACQRPSYLPREGPGRCCWWPQRGTAATERTRITRRRSTTAATCKTATAERLTLHRWRETEKTLELRQTVERRYNWGNRGASKTKN